MYYDTYPTGHPERISKPEQYDMSWYGFVFCKILAPRGLYLPVFHTNRKPSKLQNFFWIMQNVYESN